MPCACIGIFPSQGEQGRGNLISEAAGSDFHPSVNSVTLGAVFCAFQTEIWITQLPPPRLMSYSLTSPIPLEAPSPQTQFPCAVQGSALQIPPPLHSWAW